MSTYSKVLLVKCISDDIGKLKSLEMLYKSLLGQLNVQINCAYTKSSWTRFPRMGETVDNMSEKSVVIMQRRNFLRFGTIRRSQEKLKSSLNDKGELMKNGNKVHWDWYRYCWKNCFVQVRGKRLDTVWWNSNGHNEKFPTVDLGADLGEMASCSRKFCKQHVRAVWVCGAWISWDG